MPAVRITQASVDVVVKWPTRRVLIYHAGSASNFVTALANILWDLGYLVQRRTDTNLATDTWIEHFDVVIGMGLTSGLGDDLRADCEAAGVPYMLWLSYSGGTEEPGRQGPAYDALLTGTHELGHAADTMKVNIVDDAHAITSPFGLGLLTYAAGSSINDRESAVDAGQSTVGSVLAHADDAASNWDVNQPILIAIPEGTDDLDSPPVPTTVRSVVFGSHSTYIAFYNADGKNLLHRMVLWLTGDLVSPPGTPTLTATVDSQVQVSLAGSVYVAGQSGPHIASQWQITTFADTGYATPVYDSGQDANALTKKVYAPLDAGIQYRARVRYLEEQTEGDEWSNWSTDDTFTMWVAPDAPTVTVLTTAPDRASFESTAFSSSDTERVHAAIEWQLTLAADTGFATPLATQLVEQGDLLTFGFTGLDLWVNQYIARARHKDDNGGWSAWSAASSATGLVADGQFYTAFAERPIGTDISTDVPADWDEIPDGDYSDWPIEYRPDATCEVVSHRSSVDGDANTGDPIFWQGFPQVDEQIVWTRLLFEEQGGAGYPCGSGVQSPSGLICRESLGLLQTADMENDLWEVIRDGAGEWIFVPDGGPDGEPTRRYVAPGGGSDEVCQTPSIGSGADVPHARLDWLTAGDRAAGQWAQLRANTVKTCKFGTEQDDTFLAGWPGISFCGFAAGDKDDSYIGQTVRYCTLYINWMRTTIYKYVGGLYSLLHWHSAAQQFPVGRYQWNYFKVGWDTDYQWSSYSGASGARAEFSKITGADDGWDHGRVGLWYDRCEQYDPGETTTDYLDLVICSGNIVTLKNLLDGWHVRILSDSHGDQGERVYGDGGADVEWDFSTQAWPANTLQLYNSNDALVDEWAVPDGIWGGDVYYINAGGLGVGPIGGAAVRLGP